MACIPPEETQTQDGAMRAVMERAPLDMGCREPLLSRVGIPAQTAPMITMMTIAATCDGKQKNYTATCALSAGEVHCSVAPVL